MYGGRAKAHSLRGNPETEVCTAGCVVLCCEKYSHITSFPTIYHNHFYKWFLRGTLFQSPVNLLPSVDWCWRWMQEVSQHPVISSDIHLLQGVYVFLCVCLLVGRVMQKLLDGLPIKCWCRSRSGGRSTSICFHIFIDFSEYNSWKRSGTWRGFLRVCAIWCISNQKPGSVEFKSAFRRGLSGLGGGLNSTQSPF